MDLNINHKERSIQDINEILQYAKIKEDDLLPTTQTIYFSSEELSHNKYKLLEVDNNLLEEIKEGKTLCFKGEDHEDITLCTNNKTYKVYGSETSNSLLFVNNLKFFDDLKSNDNRHCEKIEVCGIFHEYLEPVLIKPNIKKLKDLLSKSLYKGPELEYDVDDSNLYNFEDLNCLIQMSQDELKEALDSMIVVKINNKIRLLDFEYHFRVLSYMLKLIDENSWTLNSIDYDETINSLCDLVPKEILSSLFDKYTEETQVIDGVQLYRYKEEKICKFFAQLLLSQCDKFNLNDFLQAWQESVPEGMITKEDMLQDIAVIDTKSQPNIIFALNEDTLPDNIIQRLNKLFDIKVKWASDEIIPFVRNLVNNKSDVITILGKYCRVSTLNGIKYYSAKHKV